MAAVVVALLTLRCRWPLIMFGSSLCAPVAYVSQGFPHIPLGGGTDHGIVGVRERACALGGELTASRGPNGSFTVVAELPVSPRCGDAR